MIETCINTSKKLSQLIDLNNKCNKKYEFTITTIFDKHNLNILGGLDTISSNYLLEKYIDTNLKYVKPNEILLSTNDQTVKDTYHYVPILETLIVFLKNKSVLDDIFREKKFDNIEN